MEMDAFEEAAGSNDHLMIIRGKRTKRRRPLSPVGRAITSCSSSGGGESGCSEGGGRQGEGIHLYSLTPSSAANSEISTSTEEDEDMANCLILLAQGGSIKQEEEEEEVKMEKLISSRRFNELVTTKNGKAGFYVYECKTCNRTFPSFQALGGHRASHKKPRTTVEEKKAVDATTGDHHEEEEEEDRRQLHRLSGLPLATESSNKGSNKPKIHECSICGSEFSSGQALGGHMRRHRNPTSTKVTIETSSTDTEKPGNIFPLDLNLPAPEDDHRDLKFQFAANQQHLVFSAPALVDCHY